MLDIDILNNSSRITVSLDYTEIFQYGDHDDYSPIEDIKIAFEKVFKEAYIKGLKRGLEYIENTARDADIEEIYDNDNGILYA